MRKTTLITFLIFSIIVLPGCFGGTREVKIIFPGEDVVCQVATNEKIPVVVKNGDKAETTKKDIGQAVVLPLHQYRAMRARIIEVEKEKTP